MATSFPHQHITSGATSAVEQLAARRHGRVSQRRFAIGGLVIVAAIVYLVFSSFSSAVSSVVSPGQLLGRGSAVYGQSVRLTGVVTSDDRTDAATLAHVFQVTGGRRSLVVSYGSDLPGGFKRGATVEAQGAYNGRFFTATSLTAKCPTKYQDAPKGA